MAPIRCKDWQEFCEHTKKLALLRSQFDDWNWSTTDNESDVESSTVETLATFNNSAWTNNEEDLQILRRQKLDMNKYYQMAKFLESLDSDWENKTEFDNGEYEEALRNMNMEELPEVILSEAAMLSTENNEIYRMQELAKQQINSVYAKCARAARYVENIDDEEWEAEMPLELGSRNTSAVEICEIESFLGIKNESAVINEQHPVFNEFDSISENGVLIPDLNITDSEEQNSPLEVECLNSNESQRELDKSIVCQPADSVNRSDELSLVENDNSQAQLLELNCISHAPPGINVLPHRTIYDDGSAKIVTVEIKDENKVSVDYQKSPTGNLSSPDDPLGFQHLTWEETTSPSDVAPTAVLAVPEKPTAEKMRPCLPFNRKLTYVIEDSKKSSQYMMEHGHLSGCAVVVKDILKDVNSNLKLECTVSTSVCDESSEPTQANVVHEDNNIDEQRKVSTSESLGVNHGKTINLQPLSESMRFYRSLKRKLSQPESPTNSVKVSQGLMPDVRLEDNVDASETIAKVDIATQDSKCSVSSSVDGQKNRTQNCGVPGSNGDADETAKVTITNHPSNVSSPNVSLGVENIMGQESEPIDDTARTSAQPVPSDAVAVATAKITPSITTDFSPAPKRIRHCYPAKQKLTAAISPTTPKKVHFDFTPQVMAGCAKDKGSNHRAERTNRSSLHTHTNYDPHSVSLIDDDGEETFENLFKKQQSTPLALEEVSKVNVIPAANSPENSSDSFQSAINSILEITKRSFAKANKMSRKKRASSKSAKSKIIKTSNKKLTKIVKKVVTEALQSFKRPRKLRKRQPPRKILIKKVVVPKRKHCVDKAVQVVFNEDKSTSTSDITLTSSFEKLQTRNKDKEIQECLNNQRNPEAKKKNNTKNRPT